ncbi:hypothetical protein PoB_003839600 [Plakobranchus ocellatus]|uniref:Uncharacterized protein n=1 Tax=Plakobranchus ocellatus TaxID=259542 RepID=A0AAV4AL40_9GAST|nr:hypothetical protein PoB_003839600 [Plakobranchus ocellatus]
MRQMQVEQVAQTQGQWLFDVAYYSAKLLKFGLCCCVYHSCLCDLALPTIVMLDYKRRDSKLVFKHSEREPNSASSNPSDTHS